MNINRIIITPLRNYLTWQRALGRGYRKEEWILRGLDLVLHRDYPCARVFTKAMFERWALEPAALSPTSRRHRMLCVAKFCRYLARMRPTTFVPNPRTFPKQLPHQAPYLLSEHEVVRLLAGTPTPRVTINIRLALNVWWRNERKRGPV